VSPASKSASGSLVELVVIVAVALGLALGIQAVLVKPYRIPSESMERTLNVGQRVLVNRIGNRFSPPTVGEVVVFHPPDGSETNTCGTDRGEEQACSRPTRQHSDLNFIKRAVAGPGDRLRIRDGRVVLNGETVDEPYARPCGTDVICDLPQEITIPPDHWFMMGDNRGASDDSRIWGPVPREWIIGEAFATYWPPRRVGLL
jgi:signal peptidase I